MMSALPPKGHCWRDEECPLCARSRLVQRSKRYAQMDTLRVQLQGACLFRRGASMMLRLSVEGSEHAIADNRNTAAQRSGTCHLRRCANPAISIGGYADRDRRRQTAPPNKGASPFPSGGGQHFPTRGKDAPPA